MHKSIETVGKLNEMQLVILTETKMLSNAMTDVFQILRQKLNLII